jgi:hypothetical protein
MGPQVIGRITAATDRPRGPDVKMSVCVPDAWFADGATIEIELPRNVACAACEGGGCDRCDRSGAVSLRGRKDPAETVEVTLLRPAAGDDAPSSKSRLVVMRIPDRGGHCREGEELPRGNLLLSVKSGSEPSRGVKRLAQPSMPPPPAAELVSTSLVPRESASGARLRLGLLIAAAVLALGILWRILH